MKTLIIENFKKIKKASSKISKKLNIKIFFNGEKVLIKGEEFNEFIAEKVIKAVDRGFEIDDALLLTNDNFCFEIINLKEHTRRKNLKDVRARVIGTQGKARKTIEGLTGCKIVIKDNTAALISDYEHLDAVIQALISLSRGAKHSNVFSYLEKCNKHLKQIDNEDLGLRKLKK